MSLLSIRDSHLCLMAPNLESFGASAAAASVADRAWRKEGNLRIVVFLTISFLLPLKLKKRARKSHTVDPPLLPYIGDDPDKIYYRNVNGKAVKKVQKI